MLRALLELGTLIVDSLLLVISCVPNALLSGMDSSDVLITKKTTCLSSLGLRRSPRLLSLVFGGNRIEMR